MEDLIFLFIQTSLLGFILTHLHQFKMTYTKIVFSNPVKFLIFDFQTWCVYQLGLKTIKGAVESIKLNWENSWKQADRLFKKKKKFMYVRR